MATLVVKVVSGVSTSFTAAANLVNTTFSTVISGVTGHSTEEEDEEEKKLLRVQSEERLLEPRVPAGGDDCCGRCLSVLRTTEAEVRWGYVETHGMMFDEPLEEFSWWVRWNPIYWSLIIIIMFCLLPGRWVHIPVGQGGPVRDDEMPQEKLARIQWIYCTDGPMALTVALCGFELVDSRHDGAAEQVSRRRAGVV